MGVVRGVAGLSEMASHKATPNSYTKLLIGGSLVLVVLVAVLIQNVQIEQLATPTNTSVQYLQWLYKQDSPHHMTEWVKLTMMCNLNAHKKHSKLNLQNAQCFVITQLAAQNGPVVLWDTPFDQWTSAQWSPFSLSRKVSRVLSKKGTANVFKYFATDQPLSTIESFTEKKPFQEVIYSGGKFFELLKKPFNGYYYYASGGIELLELKDAVYTDELLEMLTFPSHSNAGMGLGQVNFWFGKEHVTAYTHYDTSYNLHMMIRGKKKFLIYPPSTFSANLHPCLHQFYRQVHSGASPEDAQFEPIPIEVILNPGEVLFLPPYWFHRVVTLKSSISMNVWSHSKAFLTMEEVYASPIPFEEEWGRIKLMKTLNHFICEWIKLVFLENPSEFVYEHIFGRYEPLLKKLGGAEAHEAVVTVKDYCQQDSETITDILSSESVAHIRDQFAKVLKLFSEIHPKSVLKINFANYIEHVTWRILGTQDIILLPFFFQECF